MMRRVRDISSGEYFHYISAQEQDLPDTVPRVEEFISSKYENLLNLYVPFVANIDGVGKITYNKNAEYWAWVYYSAYKNKNRNNFLGTFINELKLTGAKVYAAEGAPVLALQKAVKGTMREVTLEDVEKIIAAPELTPDDVAPLELKASTGSLTEAEINSLCKYNFREYYNNNSDLTSDLLIIYNKSSVRGVYQNLTQILNTGNVPAHEAVLAVHNHLMTEVAIDGHVHTKHTDDRLDAVERHHTALKFITDCGFTDIKDKKAITRKQLLDNITGNYAEYLSKCKYTCNLFGVKTPTLPPIGDKNFIRDALRFINGKLKTQYGISIKATDKKSKYYKLAFTYKFTWEGGLNL